MENGNNLILFPDYEDLKREVEKLRTELSMLILERDELRLVKCKNIEMQYMLEIGSLEYKTYETQCAMLRLRRKLEMIQARCNRQETIRISDIERALDAEFTAYQVDLKAQMNKINAAMERMGSDKMSPKDEKELKTLYRQLVKALHPDLHPDLPPEKAELFQHAIRAYENGDLAIVRMIAMMASSIQPDVPDGDAMTLLAQERKRLIKSVAAIHAEMEQIRSAYPFTMKSILDDPDKLNARKEEIKAIQFQYEQAIIAYQAKITEILG